jgi:hypothetical protein
VAHVTRDVLLSLAEDERPQLNDAIFAVAVEDDEETADLDHVPVTPNICPLTDEQIAQNVLAARLARDDLEIQQAIKSSLGDEYKSPTNGPAIVRTSLVVHTRPNTFLQHVFPKAAELAHRRSCDEDEYMIAGLLCDGTVQSSEGAVASSSVATGASSAVEVALNLGEVLLVDAQGRALPRVTGLDLTNYPEHMWERGPFANKWSTMAPL